MQDRHSQHRWREALAISCRQSGRLLPSICAEQDPIFRRSLIIGRTGIRVRLCAFLISIEDRLAVTPYGELEFPLPQIDIAAYLATSPESVCRTMRQLREEGIIAMPRRDLLTILDHQALHRIASGA